MLLCAKLLCAGEKTRSPTIRQVVTAQSFDVPNIPSPPNVVTPGQDENSLPQPVTAVRSLCALPSPHCLHLARGSGTFDNRQELPPSFLLLRNIGRCQRLMRKSAGSEQALLRTRAEPHRTALSPREPHQDCHDCWDRPGRTRRTRGTG